VIIAQSIVPIKTTIAATDNQKKIKVIWEVVPNLLLNSPSIKIKTMAKIKITALAKISFLIDGSIDLKLKVKS
jgi:hypothetical protein